ncbi:MAG: MFS transporter [Paracoccus denitrificans]|nr:MAG: MFS transporter [Paracoccus denitrificans]PZO84495.1 MAG: MFS transporter [Paracoccus denitrificans]
MASSAVSAAPHQGEDDIHHVSASDIAVGVVIGRTSEFFDFFVYAIASVIVFPKILFPHLDPVEGTLWSFFLFALAFVARPIGTAFFLALDRRHGRVAKLTGALLLLGTSTVAMGLIPTYASAGIWAAVALGVLRIGQGMALGGSWDGLSSLLALSAPKNRRGFFTMVPQMGAPIGLLVASLLYAYLVYSLTEEDFLSWGWRYPFFVAFAINVVALFARLRIVATQEYIDAFTSSELQPTPLVETFKANVRPMILGAYIPLATFAMFHMVSVFAMSWVFLYTNEVTANYLLLEAAGAVVGLIAVVMSGYLADRLGRRRLLLWAAIAIAIFAVVAPVLLSAGKGGEAIYLLVGFAILGISFGQSSGAVATLFEKGYRYTASAVVSDFAWLFGAGLAPLTGLLLTHWFGLPAAGLYLLSGSICTLIALWLSARLMQN